MRSQLTKLTEQLNRSDDFDARLVRELNQLGAQLTKLLTEIRHSETLAAQRVRHLTYAEQSSAILGEWLVYLPPEQAARFLADATQMISPKPLELK